MGTLLIKLHFLLEIALAFEETQEQGNQQSRFQGAFYTKELFVFKDNV